MENILALIFAVNAYAGAPAPAIQSILKEDKVLRQKAKACRDEDGALAQEIGALNEGGYKDRAALDALRRKARAFGRRWEGRSPVAHRLKDVQPVALDKDTLEKFANAVGGLMYDCGPYQPFFFYSDVAGRWDDLPYSAEEKRVLATEIRAFIRSVLRHRGGVGLMEYLMAVVVLAKLAPEDATLKKLQAEAEAYRQVLREQGQEQEKQGRSYDARRFIEALKKETAWTSQAVRKLQDYAFKS